MDKLQEYLIRHQLFEFAQTRKFELEKLEKYETYIKSLVYCVNPLSYCSKCVCNKNKPCFEIQARQILEE